MTPRSRWPVVALVGSIAIVAVLAWWASRRPPSTPGTSPPPPGTTVPLESGASAPPPTATPTPLPRVFMVAHADLAPAGGSRVGGVVLLRDLGEEKGVTVQVKALRLLPGSHGLHIGEIGDCSAGDGSSAGAHFNPAHTRHGAHAGDLGNLTASALGRIETTFVSRSIRLGTGAGSILGRSIVLTEGPDDLRTDPDGAAGKPIACGVIRSP